ncbi:uncharacterized protein FFMR_07743 [Fusarium fujikuroi]|jgi:predicted DNA-binding WGR domain protein
MVNNL